MKKILLSACLALGITAGANANSCTYMNLTACTYAGSTQGGYVTIPPGTTFFASPANISNPLAAPSGTFDGLKIDLAPGFATQLYVGTAGPTSAVSSTVGVYPACNAGNAYTVSWNVGAGPAFNIVVLIF